MLHTHLTTHWGLRYPIVSAPMAGRALGPLAHAVTQAGGLGMMGFGYLAEPATVEREAPVARGDGDGRFGIGLMVWMIQRRPDLLEAALAARPFLLSLSFGDPAPYVEQVHRHGILVATQVSSREQARQALEAGVDVIVAQGTEAGGHTGAVATLPLLQIVLETVGGQRPVLAAGGIASPQGLAAILAAGADGAWIGTALLAAPEANVTDAARQRLLAASERDTVRTRAFDVAENLPWPREYPGRALRNTFADRWTGREDELPAHPDVLAAHQQAVQREDYTQKQIYAGQAVGLVTAVRPVAQILREIADGAEQLLRSRLPALLGPA